MIQKLSSWLKAFKRRLYMDQNTFIVFLLGGIGLLWVVFRQKKREETIRREIRHSVPVRRMSEVSKTSESRKRDLDRMARLQGSSSNGQSPSVDTNFPNALLLYPLLSGDGVQHDTPRQHSYDHVPGPDHHQVSHDEHSSASDGGNSNVSDPGDSGGESGGGGGD